MGRSEHLQGFLDAALAAYDRLATDGRSRDSIRRLFTQLQVPGVPRAAPGERLPVCDEVLPRALDNAGADPRLSAMVARFRTLEPSIAWKRRPKHDGSASANFAAGHANGMIVGPGGIEERDDLWLGVSLLAPHVRYPDHDHPPEETYLVMSAGEFRQAENEWFSPGIGGSFYNPPGIRHAMRSGAEPLLALWALPAGRP